MDTQSKKTLPSFEDKILTRKAQIEKLLNEMFESKYGCDIDEEMQYQSEKYDERSSAGKIKIIDRLLHKYKTVAVGEKFDALDKYNVREVELGYRTNWEDGKIVEGDDSHRFMSDEFDISGVFFLTWNENFGRHGEDDPLLIYNDGSGEGLEMGAGAFDVHIGGEGNYKNLHSMKVYLVSRKAGESCSDDEDEGEPCSFCEATVGDCDSDCDCEPCFEKENPNAPKPPPRVTPSTGAARDELW